MNTIHHHLCLVSVQPTPNLTPALDRRLAPRHVILLTTPSMRAQAGWLTDVLSRRGVRVNQWPVAHAWDIEHLQSRVLDLLAEYPDAVENQRIALNATGGTKPMSIAAYEVFRSQNLPIFYVHPERDRIVWLHHPAGQQAAFDIEDRIRIEPFLQAHGVTVPQAPPRNIPAPALLETGQQIVLRLEEFRRPLGTLNYLAHKAEKTLGIDIGKAQYQQAKALIALFEEKGFLRHAKGRLEFHDEAARFFVNGGWLEYLVFDAVRKVRKRNPQIQDIARSVEVQRNLDGRKVPNELDVVFLCNNRLNIIECKTSRFRGQGEDSHGAGILYKLDALGDIMGGLNTHTMLVSYQDVRRHDRDRARDMGIGVCAGKDLLKLGEAIERMIRP